MSQLQIIIRRKNVDFESRLSFTKGESLLLLCQKAGISIEMPCNGKGICGKCRVQFVQGAPLPQPAERRSLTPDEMRQGIRLACVVRLTENCEVVLPEQKEPDVVGGHFHIGWEQPDIPESQQKGSEGYFAVADIGTTTLVMEKRKKTDGSIADTYKAVNAQRAYGADVLTRMEAALDGKEKELSELIKAQLAEGLQQFQSDGETVEFIVIAANTTMTHLLMQYDVTGLSRAPFRPETVEEIVTEIAGVRTYVMPGISAFVGGDIVAGLYAVEAVDHSSRQKLLIDLGTNAELVLYNKAGGRCCATAAGPAFDGDAGTGFFGSDMVAVLAQLLKDNIVDETGMLEEAYFETGVEIATPSGVLHISQKQIRSLQLAKAAVRAGIEVLLQKEGIGPEQVDRVYLAGGFGYYLNIQAAVQIGLLPEALEKKTIACGNTALLGAAAYAHQILTGAKKELGLSLIPLNLAEEPYFTENYVNHMNLIQS
jgi:uncharacterized 2Fe-2S/4Fe-4S cluster protein (DUF4445 family)